MGNPTTEIGQERRILNEAIEHSYIECAGLAASIRTHYQTGSGIIRSLFELFYFNVAVLYDLTADLSEMNSSEKAKTELEAWLNLPPLKNTGKDVDDRCKEGLKCFRQYKIELSKNGVLALPS
jgi:hypothetical protein